MQKTLKSSKVRTADSTVVKCITWPHELVYISGVQSAIYEQFSVPLFASGYIAFLNTVKSGFKEVMLKHLQELMADSAIYGWEHVRTYHAVWLQQIENGHAEWEDTDIKLEFCRALILVPTFHRQAHMLLLSPCSHKGVLTPRETLLMQIL